MSSGATDPASQLEGRWSLTKIADVAAPDGARMIVTGGQVDIFVGCNTISAVAMLGPSFAQFRDIATTKMACAPETLALETKVMEALTRIETMHVGLGDVLSFYDGMNALQIGAVSAES
ncbi:MAG: META domain-containing protein [Hyphomonadaceae bacterium]